MSNAEKEDKKVEAAHKLPSDIEAPLSGFVISLAAVAALGGLLFGFDTGVISGALLFLKPKFQLSPGMVGAVAAMVLAGATLGAATTGTLAEKFGRRSMLLVAAVCFALGALLTAITPDISLLFAGRFVVGYAIGIASYVSPLYISESSPSEYRGTLVSLNQQCITLGIFLAYVVDYLFAQYPEGWRWMFGIGIAPAVILGLAMIYLPDTPRSLIERGYPDAAKRLLGRIYEQHEEKVFKAIKAGLEKQKAGWGELFSPRLRIPVIVGCALAVFQQVTGINTVIYFAPTIFQTAGFSSASVAILATAGVGFVNMVMTLPALFLLDRLGRRPLMFAGLFGMMLALTLLGVGFHLPPSERGILAIACLMGYVACFAFSMGPIFWLMIAEIYPLRVRGRAMGIATMCNWLSNLIVTFTFPIMLSSIGPSASFWIYAFITLTTIGFCYFWMPETKGKSLEEIETWWLK